MRNPPPEHRFKPGQSGNPGGRPKGASITSALREVLAELDPKSREEVRKAMARALIKKALKGDVYAAQFVAERAEGKVKDVVQLEQQSRMPELDDAQLAARFALGLKKKVPAAPEDAR